LLSKQLFFINGFIFANWVSRLPRIQEMFNADDGTIGLVLLASSIGAVAAMPFTGWVIIKNGSRRITLISAILYCALVPLIPLCQNLFALIILYFFMGIVTGMLDVAMNAQAILVEREYKRPIMTSFHALFSIGMMLGAASASLFTDIELDLVQHFFLVSGASLLGAAWMSRHLIYDRPEATHQDGPLVQTSQQIDDRAGNNHLLLHDW
jgi:MFS family permease